MAEPSDPWRQLPAKLQSQAIQLRDYMLKEGRLNGDPNVTLDTMCSRFLEAGLPLTRCATIVRLLHSENAASMRVWEAGKGASYIGIPFRSNNDAMYTTSPSALAHREHKWVRFNPQQISDKAFGIVEELKSDGITDYICAPTLMVSGHQNVFTFATKASQGFSAQDVAFLHAAFPAIEAAQEILVLFRQLNEVTRIYVGEEPHRRILAGDVHRGQVSRLRSAILFADMRDFTGLTSRMSAEEATALLNAYYDCIVPAVEENSGEVLKFIGDGVLAIFRSLETDAVACRSALKAAKRGLGAVRNRSASDAPKFDVGISLHIGEVAYGNVGSGERLDYTVIGSDVNIAARIAGLCGSLEKPLLVSKDFADLLQNAKIDALGSHTLKGLQEPIAVFAPSD